MPTTCPTNPAISSCTITKEGRIKKHATKTSTYTRNHRGYRCLRRYWSCYCASICRKRGAHIGLIARGQAGLESAARDVEALGGKALIFPTDVANAEQVELAAAGVEEIFGPIDLWINVAMTSVFSPAIEMTAEDYRRVTEVTYLGYVYGTLAALRRMIPRDKGHIIQIGSALAYRSIPLQSAYCASKHAIKGFTNSVRCEVDP